MKINRYFAVNESIKVGNIVLIQHKSPTFVLLVKRDGLSLSIGCSDPTNIESNVT